MERFIDIVIQLIIVRGEHGGDLIIFSSSPDLIRTFGTSPSGYEWEGMSYLPNNPGFYEWIGVVRHTLNSYTLVGDFRKIKIEELQRIMPNAFR